MKASQILSLQDYSCISEPCCLPQFSFKSEENKMYTRLTLGLIALSVSYYFSWRFISAGAISAADVSVALAFVIVTETAKILFMGDVVYLARTGQHEKASWTGLLVAVLFLLSVSATAYNLISAGAVASIEASQNDKRHQNAQAALDSIRADIATTAAALKACPQKHSSNCIQPNSARLSTLRQNELQAISRLDSLQPAATEAGAFWQKLGAFMGADASNLEMVWAFLRGFLLEILGLVLVAQGMAGFRLAGRSIGNQTADRVTGLQSDSLTAGNLTADKPAAIAGAGGVRVAGSFDTGTGEGQDSRFQAVKAAVLAGDVSPSTSQIRKKFRCDYNTAAGYLQAMAGEGVLRRDEVTGQYSR